MILLQAITRTLSTENLLICHNLQIDVNSLPGACLSSWRTLITAWTMFTF